MRAVSGDTSNGGSIMSTTLSAASCNRVGARKRRLGAFAALLASVALIPVGPVSAGGDDHDHHRGRTVVVHEGESIQEAIDDAQPGTKILVRGHHAENVWIYKDDIELVGKKASLTMPDDPVPNPCEGYDPETDTVFPTLVCVHPLPFDEVPPPPEVILDDIEISGLKLGNPLGDTIGVYFAHDVDIERNNVTESGCSGIWLLFVDDFEVVRNRVSNSVDCGNIDIAASTDGEVIRNRSTGGGFAGISLDDVSDVKVHRNRASGNCIGIVASNSPGDLPSTDVRITRNTTNGNNTICYPFGPPGFGPPIGAAGIVVAGVTDALVYRNTANDNVSTDPAGTITPGGIVISDFDTNVSSNIVVRRNKATGNSTYDPFLGEVVPLDINVTSIGSPISVSRNHCEFSAPNADWCDN